MELETPPLPQGLETTPPPPQAPEEITEAQLFGLAPETPITAEKSETPAATITQQVTAQKAESTAKAAVSILDIVLGHSLSWYGGGDSQRYRLAKTDKTELEEIAAAYFLEQQAAPSPTLLFVMAVVGIIGSRISLAHSDRKEMKRREAAEAAAAELDKKRRAAAAALQQQQQQQEDAAAERRAQMQLIVTPVQQEKPAPAVVHPESQSDPVIKRGAALAKFLGLDTVPASSAFPELYNRRRNFELKEGAYLKVLDNTRRYNKEETPETPSPLILKLMTQAQAAGERNGWDEKTVKRNTQKRLRESIDALRKLWGMEGEDDG